MVVVVHGELRERLQCGWRQGAIIRVYVYMHACIVSVDVGRDDQTVIVEGQQRERREMVRHSFTFFFSLSLFVLSLTIDATATATAMTAMGYICGRCIAMDHRADLRDSKRTRTPLFRSLARARERPM